MFVCSSLIIYGLLLHLQKSPHVKGLFESTLDPLAKQV